MAEWKDRRKWKERQRQLRELEQKIREKEAELQRLCSQCDTISVPKKEQIEQMHTQNVEKEQTEYIHMVRAQKDGREWIEQVHAQKGGEEWIKQVRVQRKEENEAYLRAVQADIERRVEFEDQLCDEMRGVSRSFKHSAERMMQEWVERTQNIISELNQNTEEILQKIEKNAANAANIVVNTERRIRRDDCDALLWNFCELQEQLFYNVSEKELGLKPTQIERYLRRFLKVLNRMGYEHYIPEMGEVFEEEFHEEGRWADSDIKKQDTSLEPRRKEETFEMLKTEYVVSMIHYGFKKEGEICVRAKVTVEKK